MTLFADLHLADQYHLYRCGVGAGKLDMAYAHQLDEVAHPLKNDATPDAAVLRSGCVAAIQADTQRIQD